MMLPRRKLVVPKTNHRVVDCTAFSSNMNTEVDENLLPFQRASICYNFSSKTGALTEGIGIQELHFPSEIAPSGYKKVMSGSSVALKGVWQFRHMSATSLERNDGIVVLNDNNQFLFTMLNSYSSYLSPIVMPPFLKSPSAINYRLNGEDVMIFASPQDDLTVWNPERISDQVRFEHAPRILSCCLHYERLFAIDATRPDRLWFSKDLDPTNWNISTTEGGFIEMVDERGMMQKVLSFHDYVFVFRDFGISRISAYGEQAEFSVTQLFTSSGKISAGSIAICGDKILFLAKDGLHYFGGQNTQRLTLGIESMFEPVNEATCSAYLNGKYYLACKMNFDDNEQIGCEKEAHVNNALFVLDINSGAFQIVRGIDISAMTAFNSGSTSKIIFCFRGEHASKLGEIIEGGSMFDMPLVKTWKSPKSNLGFVGRKKIVKTISLFSNYDCTIVVSCDNQEKKFLVKGSKTAIKINPNMKGELVQVTFMSQADKAHISRPQIVFGVL